MSLPVSRTSSSVSLDPNQGPIIASKPSSVNEQTQALITKTDLMAENIQPDSKGTGQPPVSVAKDKIEVLSTQAEAREVKEQQKGRMEIINSILSLLSFLFGPLLSLFRKGSKEVGETKSTRLHYAVDELAKLFDREEFYSADGVFRIPANKQKIDELYNILISSKEGKITEKVHEIDNPALAASLLKKIYKEIPIFDTAELHQEVLTLGNALKSSNPSTNNSDDIQKLNDLIKKLSDDKKSDLNKFIKLLSEISQHSSKNQMTASNLALSIADTLSPCPAPDPKDPSAAFGMVKDLEAIKEVTKLLIENYEQIDFS